MDRLDFRLIAERTYFQVQVHSQIYLASVNSKLQFYHITVVISKVENCYLIILYFYLGRFN
jgi:hypothetical protein